MYLIRNIHLGFFPQSDILNLLIGVYSPFTFNVLTDILSLYVSRYYLFSIIYLFYPFLPSSGLIRVYYFILPPINLSVIYSFAIY